MAFTERAFRLAQTAVNQTLNDNFSISGDMQIDSRRLDNTYRSAGQSAGHSHLILIDRQLLRAGKQDHGRTADDDSARHGFFSFLVFSPMQIAAGAARPRRHTHAETILGFQSPAIGTHVLHARLRIAGDAKSRGEIGSGIKAWRRDRYRQASETFTNP